MKRSACCSEVNLQCFPVVVRPRAVVSPLVWSFVQRCTSNPGKCATLRRGRECAFAKAHDAEPHITEVSATRSSEVVLADAGQTADFDSQQDLPHLETLKLLEWPELCRQVAAFTQTVVAAEQILTVGLPLGASQAASENLQQQTAEGQEANLDFRDAQDIRALLQAAQQEDILTGFQLNAVAATLQVGHRIRELLVDQQAHQKLATLYQLSEGLRDTGSSLNSSIRQAIQAEDHSILDRASESLGRLRKERGDNIRQLRQQADEWARLLHSKGVSERNQVVMRRNRLCVPVRANRQSEVPKGSIRLGQSTSGATLYLEPAPIVALNNNEARLADAVAAEEARVLRRLTRAVAKHDQLVCTVLDALTALDIATARGRHAAWMSGTRPCFLSARQAGDFGCTWIHAACHPLLLQRVLPPLPAIPTDDEVKSEQPAASSREARGAWQLQPVDLLVPPNVRVAAVTGPNTGGKTASLKTLGLMALMAKAGLFLPIRHAANASQPREAVEQSSLAGAPISYRAAEQPGQQPMLEWFGSVLADVGDSQDLQQSLSTFSGHVRRLGQILAAADSQSLVLLDEVGSGTDPNEGAALATAVLSSLASRARFTFATTHHASLNHLASRDPRFMNASVEFDQRTLRPTYRLVWGAAGASHALSVAEGLKFDPTVLADARQIATAGRDAVMTGGKGTAQAQAIQGSIKQDLAGMKDRLQSAASNRQTQQQILLQLEEEVSTLEKDLSALQGNKAERSVRAAVRQAQKHLDDIVRDCQAGGMSPQEARKGIDGVRAGARKTGRAAAAVRQARGSSAPSSGRPGWAPAPGDSVQVPGMGGSLGQVLEARSADSLIVRVGQLTLQLKASEVLAAGQQRQPRQKRPAPPQAPDKEAFAGESAGSRAVAVQTARNTIDVRGLNADEAGQALEDALADVPPGLALYVIHGVGAGKLKAALVDVLSKHPMVSSFEADTDVNGAENTGCTIVFPN